VFKTHRLLYHSTLGLRAIKKKRRRLRKRYRVIGEVDVISEELRYRGTLLIRKRTPLGPYRRPMPRVLAWS